MRRSVVRHTQRSDNIIQTLFTLGLLLLFLMVAGIAGVFVFDQVRRFIAASDVFPEVTINRTPASEEKPPVRIDPQQVYTGTERVNILVMGIDQRAGEDGPWRTDSMMVLTIDPVTLRGGILSIPRDLWVPIWAYNMQGKINTANFIGDRDGYPGGGPALAAATVEYNFGIRIHHYARVNFAAFVELVDRIGGIDICVEEEINDSYYPDEAYGYDPLHIPAGCQHFDGELALKYARTRHGGSDFDRARRQQQVIRAVFERVTRLDLLPQLALQAPELWTMLQDSVVTDPELTLDKIVALANLANKVPPGNVRYGVIDENYVDFYTTPDNQEVLIPRREDIRKLRNYIFADAPAPASDDPAARLAEEAARIEVLNGTTVEGLAGRTAEFLRQQGFQVVRADNAPGSDYAESLIIVYTGKNYTAEYLSRVLNLPPTAIVHGANPNAEYDISIILGANYQPPTQQ